MLIAPPCVLPPRPDPKAGQVNLRLDQLSTKGKKYHFLYQL